MKTVARLSRVLAILCAVILALVLVVVPQIASRAVLAQRVRVPSGEIAAIFGDEPTPVGSPQKLIITDEKAFLPGRIEGGVRLVDEGYLERTGTYPLQLKTVQFLGSLVGWGSATGLVVFGLVAFSAGRRARANPSGDSSP
ncbi:MAG: hypothetical protein AMXMBFR61_21900 [Fimbriimonadales bacterium]